MKNTAQGEFIAGLRRQGRLDRMETVRPVLARSRSMEANVSAGGLRMTSQGRMVVTQAMIDLYGWDASALGKPIFLPGYSTLTGGDFIPPGADWR